MAKYRQVSKSNYKLNTVRKNIMQNKVIIGKWYSIVNIDTCYISITFITIKTRIMEFKHLCVVLINSFLFIERLSNYDAKTHIKIRLENKNKELYRAGLGCEFFLLGLGIT